MDTEQRWIPDHDDGSGWALVDWGSTIRGTRYHYRHIVAEETARARISDFYRVVTRLQSLDLPLHENAYFVPHAKLADFLAELSLAGGVESIWHVEPCAEPPAESISAPDIP